MPKLGRNEIHERWEPAISHANQILAHGPIACRPEVAARRDAVTADTSSSQAAQAGGEPIGMSRTDRGRAAERTTSKRRIDARSQFFSVGPDWRLAVLGALLCALVWLASLGISTVPAQAELSHSLLASFGPGGPGIGAFYEVGSVAVDQSTGDVYVFDLGNASIYKFDAGGHPLNFAALGTNAITGIGRGFNGENEIAVDASSGPDKGDIYFANAKGVSIFSAEGNPLGSLSEAGACGVAVDSSGDVYVGVYPSTVRKYVPVSNPVSNADETTSMGGLSNICDVAVDGQGNLYTATSRGGVNRYGALQFGSLAATGTLLDEHGNTVALNPSSGDVYVDERSAVAQYDASGALLGRTGANVLQGSFGVAATGSGSGELLYAADETAVNIYGPTIVVAEPVTQSPSEVERTAATLNGTANPGGAVVSACKFEYRSAVEASFAHSLACKQTPAEIGEGTVPVAVSASLGGLTLQSGYIYRLVVTDANGVTYGAEESFSTESAVDAVSTGPADEITPDSAKLNGSLSPDGTDAHYYFEYGTSPEYGSVFPALPGNDAGSGGAECVPPGGPKCNPAAAETTLAGLRPNTQYYYRLVAVNSFGTSYGADEGFVTPGQPRIEGSSSEAVTRTTATLKATIDPDGYNTKYRFEYGETTAYGSSAPAPEGELLAGESEREVSADLTGLTLGKTYHFRIVATNQAGPPIDGPDEELSTVPVVVIEDESVTDVTATSATLRAQLNPYGTESAYRFEYGTSTAYGASIPIPDGNLGSGTEAVTVSQPLEDLAPNTTYHYRVSATNTLGTIIDPDRTFATQGSGDSLTLPDGREYEMVSLPNKDGAQTGAVNILGDGLEQASEDGSAVVYDETSPIGEGPQGYVGPAQVLATRSVNGWSSRDLATPHAVATSVKSNQGLEYRLFSPNLTIGLVEPEGHTPLSPEAPAAESNLYRWSEDNGGYQPLVTAFPSEPPESGVELDVVGASTDLSHVLFSSYRALTQPAVHAGFYPNLYEWAEGKLQLVNILPDGTPTAGEAGLGGTASGDTSHAVSDDGRLVVWSQVEGSTSPIYVRDMVKGETMLAGHGVYQTASSTDSRIFFIEETGENGLGATLDEFDVGSDKTIPVTADDARVQGVLGANEEGSVVYFVAQQALAEGARDGGDNLYVTHLEGTSWAQPTYIATLAGNDAHDWISAGEDLSKLTSRVSSNGRYLAFMSSQSLTGYDNRDAVSDQPDAEVYLYDAMSGKLLCASCNPSGARPAGELDEREAGQALSPPIDHTGAWDGQWLAASIPGWTTVELGRAMYQSRYLSNGGRLFFDSIDPLVSHDTNGKLDVYEYEPVGEGSCSERTSSGSSIYVPASAGCTSLISSGTSGSDSSFVDASASGDDVFFVTAARLSQQDYDGSYDMYDAHVCSTSAPCFAPAITPPPPCTTGDACKAAPSPQPSVFGAPASATFSGAGDLAGSPGANPTKPMARALTRARQLAKALKQCKRDKSKKRRAKCDATAHRAYGRGK
jgi:hypothetical protein